LSQSSAILATLSIMQFLGLLSELGVLGRALFLLSTLSFVLSVITAIMSLRLRKTWSLSTLDLIRTFGGQDLAQVKRDLVATLGDIDIENSKTNSCKALYLRFGSAFIAAGTVLLIASVVLVLLDS